MDRKAGFLFLSALYITFFGLPAASLAAENICHQQGLEIRQAEIRATPPNAPVTGGYLHIHNHGTSMQRLTAASADFSGHTEIHQMILEAGVMKMSPLKDGIEIAAGGHIQLKPGGLHIMFMQLKQPLAPSDMHQATLTFDKCGDVPVLFKVTKTPGQSDSAGHSTGHSTGHSAGHSAGHSTGHSTGHTHQH